MLRGPFHGFIAVAPLKPGSLLDPEAKLLPLPRLHRRGPIEALDPSARALVRAALPRLHRRGPIEASFSASGLSVLGTLPRLHRRGPIEAAIGAPRVRSRPRLFHGFIAVAPLKQRSRSGPARSDDLFHGFIAVAPLKPPKCQGATRPRGLFHGFIAVAPLKLPSSDLLRAWPAALPRLHRRGPIEAILVVMELTRRAQLFQRLHRRGPIEARSWCGPFKVGHPSSTASSPWPHWRDKGPGVFFGGR